MVTIKNENKVMQDVLTEDPLRTEYGFGQPLVDSQFTRELAEISEESLQRYQVEEPMIFSDPDLIADLEKAIGLRGSETKVAKEQLYGNPQENASEPHQVDKVYLDSLKHLSREEYGQMINAGLLVDQGRSLDLSSPLYIHSFKDGLSTPYTFNLKTQEKLN
jgi:hypothetical protein